jgi:putative ABC transport system substrate-binding protein
MPQLARIGVVHLGHQVDAPVVVGLRQGFNDLGYIEGQHVVLDIRAGQGDPAKALQGALELVRDGARLLVSAGTVATRAVKEAAGDLPVVFTQVGDPVASGFVQSLARPGTNMTGFAHLLPVTSAKRMELLLELAPAVRSVLMIFDPTNESVREGSAVASESALLRSVQVHVRHVRTREEALVAIDDIRRDATDSVLVLPESLVVNEGDRIIELSLREKLPVMFHEESWVERGGLASYGASFTDLARQAAGYVERILRGAQPADLPVQQPTAFELVINPRTAEALGVAVPPLILGQAPRLIH